MNSLTSENVTSINVKHKSAENVFKNSENDLNKIYQDLYGKRDTQKPKIHLMVNYEFDENVFNSSAEDELNKIYRKEFGNGTQMVYCSDEEEEEDVKPCENNFIPKVKKRLNPDKTINDNMKKKFKYKLRNENDSTELKNNSTFFNKKPISKKRKLEPSSKKHFSSSNKKLNLDIEFALKENKLQFNQDLSALNNIIQNIIIEDKIDQNLYGDNIKKVVHSSDEENTKTSENFMTEGNSPTNGIITSLMHKDNMSKYVSINSEDEINKIYQKEYGDTQMEYSLDEEDI